MVDLRTRTAYAAEHLEGSIGIELGAQFSTYLGWLIPWGSPLTLIGDTAEQVQDAQRQLVRIGIDRPDGAAFGSVAELATDESRVDAYPVATFADLADAERDTLTVSGHPARGRASGGGIDGSVHIPLHSLLERMDEVPNGPVWVHCASGYRASIAASLLARAGHDVTLVNDEYAKAGELGLT